MFFIQHRKVAWLVTILLDLDCSYRSVSSGACSYGTSWCGLAVDLAVETQSNLSVQVMNSVGLKSGFLAVLMALDLSSIFLEMVERIVLAAGTSISLAAGLFPFIALALLERVEQADELDEVEEDVEDELEEQILESESESLCELVVCPGMFPVVLSVSVCDLSVVRSDECVVIVCLSVCLWISPS